MKVSTIIAIAGSLLAMLFAFENLGMYLIGGAQPQWGGFALLMAIAAGVGALPGMVIGWMTRKQSSGDKKPPSG